MRAAGGIRCAALTPQHDRDHDQDDGDDSRQCHDAREESLTQIQLRRRKERTRRWCAVPVRVMWVCRPGVDRVALAPHGVSLSVMVSALMGGCRSKPDERYLFGDSVISLTREPSCGQLGVVELHGQRGLCTLKIARRCDRPFGPQECGTVRVVRLLAFVGQALRVREGRGALAAYLLELVGGPAPLGCGLVSLIAQPVALGRQLVALGCQLFAERQCLVALAAYPLELVGGPAPLGRSLVSL